jgi:hypothetical protein
MLVHFLLFFLIFLIVLTWRGVLHSELYVCFDLVQRSGRCTSFDDWADLMCSQPDLTCLDYSPKDIVPCHAPHFILSNHTNSHYGLASHLTMAFVSQTDGGRENKIVCFKDYSTVFVGLAGTIHQILAHEIVVDTTVLKDRHQREQMLVSSIRECFAAGRNVLWFVDGSKGYVMRGLIKKVLGYFPDTPKQVVHIRKPTGVGLFGFRRFPVTNDLEQVLSNRAEIVSCLEM